MLREPEAAREGDPSQLGRDTANAQWAWHALSRSETWQCLASCRAGQPPPSCHSDPCFVRFAQEGPAVGWSPTHPIRWECCKDRRWIPGNCAGRAFRVLRLPADRSASRNGRNRPASSRIQSRTLAPGGPGGTGPRRRTIARRRFCAVAGQAGERGHSRILPAGRGPSPRWWPGCQANRSQPGTADRTSDRNLKMWLRPGEATRRPSRLSRRTGFARCGPGPRCWKFGHRGWHA